MKGQRIWNIITIIIAVTGFLFTTLSAWPGFMSPDTLDQYNQALTGIYTDWHPPFMAWFWHQLLRIYNGPQPFLVLNSLLYWTGAMLIAFRLKKAWRLLFLVFCFAPPFINFLGVIWKDTFLFSILFFVCGVLVSSHNVTLKGFKKLFLFLLCLFLCAMAAMLRYNAFAAIFPIICLILLQYFKTIKVRTALISSALITIGFFGLASGIGKKLTHHNSSFPEQQLMTYDLMGISYYKGQSSFPDYLKKLLPIDTVKHLYNAKDGGGAVIFGLHSITSNPKQIDSLKTLWIHEMKSNPAYLFRHKFSAFNSLLFDPGLQTYHEIRANEFGFKVGEKNALSEKFISWIDDPFSGNFYFGWIYLIVCVVVFLCSLKLLKRKKTDIYLSLFISLSGLLYILSYFPLSPSNDFRYLYWSIGASFISLSLLLKETFKSAKK